eukprot:TRINITY_DN48015_c0_g1_i1.p2 TRINITY_DN48015_c0_g1~~TRINITY_DN48015_c0_g1_i1.p2  ORF type:complete len:107 (+),score=6.86 TRINITY_DN48015_c0_g1_i1:173-493(+)
MRRTHKQRTEDKERSHANHPGDEAQTFQLECKPYHQDAMLAHLARVGLQRAGVIFNRTAAAHIMNEQGRNQNEENVHTDQQHAKATEDYGPKNEHHHGFLVSRHPL